MHVHYHLAGIGTGWLLEWVVCFSKRIGFAVCAALLVAVCITGTFLCLYRSPGTWSVGGSARCLRTVCVLR
jgi:hypothetical protein